MKNYYKELTSRNQGLISKEDQAKLKSARILVAGCGVGSVIAVAAARFGFEKFILADGDSVEISNLNRQEYSKADIGKNKAKSLKNKILGINPGAKIRVLPKFVNVANVKSLLKGADIIIDTIDPEDGKAILALHQEARRNNKYIISPYDIGYGSLVIVYNPKGKTYKEMLGYPKNMGINSIEQEDFYNKFLNHTMKFIPEYLYPVIDSLLKGEIKHYPQPIIAAQAVSSCSVSLMRKIVLREKLLGNPYILTVDPELSQNWQKNIKKVYAK